MAGKCRMLNICGDTNALIILISLKISECLSILTFLFVRTKRKVTKEKSAGSRSGAKNRKIFFTLLHYMPGI